MYCEVAAKGPKGPGLPHLTPALRQPREVSARSWAKAPGTRCAVPCPRALRLRPRKLALPAEFLDIIQPSLQCVFATLQDLTLEKDLSSHPTFLVL